MNKKVSYIEFERQILFKIIHKYNSIIENKKTDSNTIFAKQKAWTKITSEYNKHPNVRKRLGKQLKRLWENTKAREKIKLTKMEQQQSTSNFEKIFISENSNNSQETQTNKKRKRKSIESTNNDESNFIDNEIDIDQFLSPIVTTRLKKLEESTEQQKEIHNISVQKEQLQIKALQEQILRDTKMHSTLLNQERELHELKINNEKTIHAQRLRNEQELHLMKISEYNKVQHISEYN